VRSPLGYPGFKIQLQLASRAKDKSLPDRDGTSSSGKNETTDRTTVSQACQRAQGANACTFTGGSRTSSLLARPMLRCHDW
jgi:hypothetical protein